ncbi:MAG: hypothetical protein JXA42_18330, partial [Anaerolineales bacterium]|nr:hypothetical protein [Anaerolineales bacterium]
MPLRLAQKHALDWAMLMGIDVVHLHLSLITPEFVDQLHGRSLLVHGSNLDTEEDIARGIQLGALQSVLHRPAGFGAVYKE